jgi:hypothetical protein
MGRSAGTELERVDRLVEGCVSVPQRSSHTHGDKLRDGLASPREFRGDRADSNTSAGGLQEIVDSLGGGRAQIFSGVDTATGRIEEGPFHVRAQQFRTTFDRSDELR